MRFNAEGYGDKVFLGQPVDSNIDGICTFMIIFLSDSVCPSGIGCILGTICQSLRNPRPQRARQSCRSYSQHPHYFSSPDPYLSRGSVSISKPTIMSFSYSLRPIVRALGLNYVDHAKETADLAGRGSVQLPK